MPPQTQEELWIPISGEWDIELGDKKLKSESLCLEDLGEYYFSGSFTAQNTFRIPEWIPLDKVQFVAEEVKDILELQINGETAGARVFAPFELDITKHVKHGENNVSIVLTNTLINELRKMPQMSGIYGKVGILISNIH